jgi:hypothetical protein
VTLNIDAQSIGISAFQNCGNLRILKLASAVPPTLGSNCFAGVGGKFVINVPAANLGDYLADDSYDGYTVIADNAAAVIFDSRGGSDIASIITGAPGLITPPADPVWNNRIFAGWYLDTDYTIPFDFDVDLSRTVIVYAKWGYVPLSLDNSLPVTVATAGEVYYYAFVPTTSGTFKIVVSGAIGGTVYAAFLNAAEAVLKSGTGTTNFEVTQNLTAGQIYIICVKMYSASVTGSFNVNITNA